MKLWSESVKKHCVSTFQGLAEALADGKEIGLGEVSRILHEVGKRPEDLDAAVKHLVRRRELRSKLADMAEMEKRRAKLERDIARLDEELRKAEEKHKAAYWPLRSELEGVKAGIQAIFDAERELRRTCADENLLNERQKLTAELDELRENRIRLEAQHSRIKRAVEDMVQSLEAAEKTVRLDSKSQKERLEEQLKELKSREEEATNELAAINKQIAEREKTLAELEKRFLSSAW